MVQLVLGMAELPRPDDAADALAIAVWGANSAREGAGRLSPVMDRAAVAPIDRGESRLRPRRQARRWPKEAAEARASKRNAS